MQMQGRAKENKGRSVGSRFVGSRYGGPTSKRETSIYFQLS